MSERRKTVRRRCLVGAKVVFNNRASTLSCTVRNHSEDGCMLIFGETPYVPTELEILLDNGSTLMPAEIVWRRDSSIGIAFPKGRFLNELREQATRSANGAWLPKPGTPLH